MDLDATIRVHHIEKLQRPIFIFDGQSAPKRIDLFAFGKSEVTFGREEDNDIVLTSQLVSRHHGRFVFENDQWFIEDLGSLNGVIYDNEKVKKLDLPEDDFVRIDNLSIADQNGVLLVFPSSDYEKEWKITTVTDANKLFIRIPELDAVSSEETPEGMLIHIPQTITLLLNGESCEGDILLHDRDILSIPGRRIVYTMNALYEMQVNDSIVEQEILLQDNMDPTDIVDDAEEIDLDRTIARPSAKGQASMGLLMTNVRPSEEAPVGGRAATADILLPEKSVTEEIPSDGQKFERQITQNEKSNGTDEIVHSHATHPARNEYIGLKGFFASELGYISLCIICALFIWGLTLFTDAAAFIILVCTYCGWIALKTITSEQFKKMPVIGYAMYIVFKAILSIILGVCVAPFTIAKMIRKRLAETK